MDIEAYILIGGRSTRFGRAKAAVEFEGSPLAERLAAVIDAAIDPPKITLVAADSAQLLEFGGIDNSRHFVFDLYEGRGPLGGLHAALANAVTPWVFVLGCDLPLISPALIRRLADSISNDTDAVAPLQPDGRVQPLCATYRVEPLLKAASSLLELNRPSPPLRSILDLFRTTLIPFSALADLPGAEHLFLNMNTPDDLNRATAIREPDIEAS